MAHWKLSNTPEGVKVAYKSFQDGQEQPLGTLPRGRPIGQAVEFALDRLRPGDFLSIDGEAVMQMGKAQDDMPRSANGELSFDVFTPDFQTAVA